MTTHGVDPRDAADAARGPRRKPFTADGVDLKTWKLASLPYLVWAPIGKTPAERELIRALKNVAKKADEIVIATDFDREGELIGSDAAALVREVNKKAPIKRARFSAITKDEIERAFAELVRGRRLPRAGRRVAPGHRPRVGRRAHALPDHGQVRRLRQRASRPAACRRRRSRSIVEREREREAFVPEDVLDREGRVPLARRRRRSSRPGTRPSRFKSAEADAKRVMDAVAGATQRHGHRGREEAPQGHAAHAVQHDLASGRGRRRGPHARRARCASPSRSTWTASSATRASTTPSTRRPSTSAASCDALAERAGVPRARARASCRGAAASPRAAPRRRPTTRRSTPPARPIPTSSSPRSGSSTTSSRAASWRRSRTPRSSRARR